MSNPFAPPGAASPPPGSADVPPPSNPFAAPGAGYGGWGPPPGSPYAVLPAGGAPGATVQEEARAGVVTAVLVVVLGGPVGLVWAALRPSVDAARIALQESANDVQIGIDLRLLLLLLVTGAGAGTLAWLLVRRRALGVVLGLAAGGVLAGLLAAQVGRLAGHPGDVTGRSRQQFAAAKLIDLDKVEPGLRSDVLDRATFQLRSPAVTLGFPVGACGVFALLTLAKDRSTP